LPPLRRDATNLGQKRRGKRKKRAPKAKAPPEETTGPNAFERMKNFTRALIAVPKSELPPTRRDE